MYPTAGKPATKSDKILLKFGLKLIKSGNYEDI